MRTYELVLILRPNITDAVKKKLLDTLKGWLKEAKIEKEDEWGIKELQFRIKKETSGFFSVLHFAMEKTIPMDFEKKLLEQENVIRHLLIRRK